jgi:UDP-glucose:(heptosyl)LPS alpha-1,3-glucosyltransferase
VLPRLPRADPWQSISPPKESRSDASFDRALLRRTGIPVAICVEAGELRIAIISPFVDKQHGTERAVAELAEHLAGTYGDDVALYAQRVADIADSRRESGPASAPTKIRWHRVATFPGPLLLKFPGWLWLNRRMRRGEISRSGNKPDVVFSPGINSLDADVILVHAIFHRLAELQTMGNRAGPRGLHRKLYYALLCKLERRIYGDPHVTLAAVSKHTAEQLKRYFGRNDVTVIPNGVDVEHFSPAAIGPLREAERRQRHVSAQQIVLLLIGNDWRNKGLTALLAAIGNCKESPVRLLVVGQDEQAPFRAQAETAGVRERVEFCAPVSDVRGFYAAADILVAPSLEDSFNLPVLEAMACGLPVIVSPKAGVSEWLTNGFDALLLKDPENTGGLAEAIRALASGPQLRKTLAENAVVTARKFSWDEHTAELRQLMEKAAAKKKAEGR